MAVGITIASAPPGLTARSATEYIIAINSEIFNFENIAIIMELFLETFAWRFVAIFLAN
jgi:hypothetical protein